MAEILELYVWQYFSWYSWNVFPKAPFTQSRRAHRNIHFDPGVMVVFVSQVWQQTCVALQHLSTPIGGVLVAATLV